MTERIVVAISGASGVIYGIRLLQALRAQPDIETHLVISSAAKQTIAAETDWAIKDIETLAHTVYDVRQIGAAIASGSFATRGMVVIPCSIKSLSAIATLYAADLITRAADVTLKEGRPLILVVRETPLHLGHLRLLTQAAETGAIIFPPMPAFYGKPQSLDDVINETVGRVLARLGCDNAMFTHWRGLRDATSTAPPRDLLRAFVAVQTTLTLATTNADGSPHSCDLYYASADDTALYFLSDPHTRHVENFLRDARASATIHGTAKEWQTIRGAQIVGAAMRVDAPAERARAYEFYLVKYPFVRQMLPNVETLGLVRENLGGIELYKLVPHWLRWIDNTQGFGHKDEWTMNLGEE